MKSPNLIVLGLSVFALIAICAIPPWFVPAKTTPPERNAYIVFRPLWEPVDRRLTLATACLELEFALVATTAAITCVAASLPRKFPTIFAGIAIWIAVACPPIVHPSWTETDLLDPEPTGFSYTSPEFVRCAAFFDIDNTTQHVAWIPLLRTVAVITALGAGLHWLLEAATRRGAEALRRAAIRPQPEFAVSRQPGRQ
jgi:hypothetical protein